MPVDWGVEPAPTNAPLSDSELLAYLSRIGLPASAARAPPDGASLRALVRAHALAIPFESYDISLRAHLSLAPRAIFAKLVERRRGGVCFETNLLLRSALQALGFELRLRAARVWMRAPAYTPHEPPAARQHVVLLVRAAGGEVWLCDVGFGGGGPAEPLLLADGAVAAAAGDVFRTSAGDARAGEDSWLLHGLQAGAWKLLYSFEHYSWDAPRVHAADFLTVSHFVQDARGSLFQSLRVATKPLADGRLTLLRRELRRRGAEVLGAEAPPHVQVRALADAEAYRAAAAEGFGIELTADEARAIWEADDGEPLPPPAHA